MMHSAQFQFKFSPRRLCSIATALCLALLSGCAYVHMPYAAQPVGSKPGAITVASYSEPGQARDAAPNLQASAATSSLASTWVRDPNRPPGGPDYASFEYPKVPMQVRVEPGKRIALDPQTVLYDQHYLSFPSVGDNGQPELRASGHYFQSRLGGKKKLMIVLPLWGSSKYPPYTIAKKIIERSQGMTNVLILEGERDMIGWRQIQSAQTEQAFVDLTRKFMTERVIANVIDMRRWLDWFEVQDDIDPQHMGLVGFSISTIVGSALYGIDRRLNAGIFVIGGANPEEILATCYWEPEETRDIILPRFGWTQQQYQNVLKPVFDPINPARFGERVDPTKVLIFDSKIDTCMPETSREALWNGFGRPERYSFLHDHKMSFMAMTPLGFSFMGERIVEFLDKKL